jgi:small nuclear ribonucleoprotein F
LLTRSFSPIRSLSFLLLILFQVDSYMNVQLANAEEYIDGQFSGALGEVLIRCNNVLHIRGVSE